MFPSSSLVIDPLSRICLCPVWKFNHSTLEAGPNFLKVALLENRPPSPSKMPGEYGFSPVWKVNQRTLETGQNFLKVAPLAITVRF